MASTTIFAKNSPSEPTILLPMLVLAAASRVSGPSLSVLMAISSSINFTACANSRRKLRVVFVDAVQWLQEVADRATVGAGHAADGLAPAAVESMSS